MSAWKAAAAALLCAALRANAASAALPPAWVRDAPGVPAGSRDSAFELYREMRVRVADDGRLVTTERRLTHLGTAASRDEWRGIVVYMQGTEEVRDVQAWRIQEAGGEPFRKEWRFDAALDPGDVYGEVRIRGFTATPAASAGDVVAFEGVCERRVLQPQFEWVFQGSEAAVAVARFSIAVPDGWWVRARVVGRDSVVAHRSGEYTTWEVRDLPEIPDEPQRPSLVHLAPRLLVEWGRGTASEDSLAWRSVGAWLAQLSDPQATIDDAVRRKAAELTGAAGSDLAKIDAVARFVQAVHYVNVQTGYGRGGGYVPRPASQVLARSYGDCKDKANLMRALLAAAGIRSWLTAVYSGDPQHVVPEWPSSAQFDHCIIAVQAPPGLESPAVIPHPSLGRLLFFDPTDDCTVLGDLPARQQGSLGVLQSATDGGLLRLPTVPLDRSGRTSRIEAEFDQAGGMAVRVHRRHIGQDAASERRFRRWLTAEEYRKRMESAVAAVATGARVDDLATEDAADGSFSLAFALRREGAVRPVQEDRIAFRPAALFGGRPVFTAASRRLPIVFEASSAVDTLTVRFPEGFRAEELPPPYAAEESFAGYSARFEAAESAVTLIRSRRTLPVVVPAEQYDRVRRFEEGVRRFESRPVELVRR